MKHPADNSQPTPKRGLECPACGCKHLEVIYVRPTEGGHIRRRRECRNCGRRITTYERSIE